MISIFFTFTIEWAHSRHVKLATFSPSIARPLTPPPQYDMAPGPHTSIPISPATPCCLISHAVSLDPSRVNWPHGQLCCTKTLMMIQSCYMWFQKGKLEECVLLWHVTLCWKKEPGFHRTFIFYRICLQLQKYCQLITTSLVIIRSDQLRQH